MVHSTPKKIHIWSWNDQQDIYFWTEEICVCFENLEMGVRVTLQSGDGKNGPKSDIP